MRPTCACRADGLEHQGSINPLNPKARVWLDHPGDERRRRQLRQLRRPGAPGVRVRLHTGSTYVRDGITRWIHAWKRNGWRTAARKPVKNADLWRRLDSAIAGHDIEWHWVRGHSGHPENERADALAGAAARVAQNK